MGRGVDVDMPPPTTCCTCAALLSSGNEDFDIESEKPIHDKLLMCCGRTVCAKCIKKNPRFAIYCPYCQITRLPRAEAPEQLEPSVEPPPYAPIDTATSAIPSQPIARNPPPVPTSGNSNSSYIQPPPPSYSSAETSSKRNADVIHHLFPNDTLASISLAYRIPIPVLRSHNRLHADHLLSARRTLGIPLTHYQGASLSPQPAEGEEESERKASLRRFMMRCKCADYKVSSLYLEENGWDLERAVEMWGADEKWEKNNPLEKGNGTSRTRGAFGRLLS